MMKKMNQNLNLKNDLGLNLGIDQHPKDTEVILAPDHTVVVDLKVILHIEDIDDIGGADLSQELEVILDMVIGHIPVIKREVGHDTDQSPMINILEVGQGID